MKVFNKPLLIKRGQNYYKIDVNGNYEKLTKSKIPNNLKEKLSDDSESTMLVMQCGTFSFEIFFVKKKKSNEQIITSRGKNGAERNIFI